MLLTKSTDAWLNLRRKILQVVDYAALLGLYVREKVEKYWTIVKEGLLESDLIKRGHRLTQTEAVQYFESTAKCSADKNVAFFLA